jgi:hypothetical protein
MNVFTFKYLTNGPQRYITIPSLSSNSVTFADSKHLQLQRYAATPQINEMLSFDPNGSLLKMLTKKAFVLKVILLYMSSLKTKE